MNPLYLLGYIIIITFIVLFIIIIITELKTLKKNKMEKNKLAPAIKYIKEGLKFGYSSEELAIHLMQNGWTLLECNRALKILKKKPV